MNKISTYLKSVVAELKRVDFPTSQQVLVRSGLVIGSILVATLFLGLIDAGLAQATKLLILK